MGLKTLPENVERVLKENEADDFVIERNKRLGWPMPPHYAQTSTSNMIESGPAPQTTTATNVSGQPNVAAPSALSVINGGSSSNMLALNHRPSEDSIDSLLSSLTGSVSSPSDADLTKSVSPPLEVHFLTSPPSVNDSVFTPDSRLSRPSPGSTHYSSVSSVVSPPSSVLSDVSNGVHTQFKQSSLDEGFSSGYSFSPSSVLSDYTNSPTNAQSSNNSLPLDSDNQSSLANTYSSSFHPQNTMAPNAQEVYTNGTGFDSTLFNQSSLPFQNGLSASGGNVSNHAMYEFTAGRQIASGNGLSTGVPSPHISVLSPPQHIHSNISIPTSNISSPHSTYSPHSNPTSYTSDSNTTYNPQRAGNPSLTNGVGTKGSGAQTLEQILSEVIELNRSSGIAGGYNKATNNQGTISVECEVHADTSGQSINGGLMNGGIAMGTTEVDDIMQQFL